MNLRDKCKALISAREEAIGGEWSDLEEETEIHAVEYCEAGGDPYHIAMDVNPMNVKFIVTAANHSAEIAAKLLVAIEKLEEIANGLGYAHDEKPWECDIARNTLAQLENGEPSE
jgi:hypothetical protein